MAKQALSKCAVEAFNNGLVSVNFSASTMNGRFVDSHFFGDVSHELTPRVNLQHPRPSQRATFVNRLKSLHNFSRIFQGQRLSFSVTAGDVDNGQRIFVNFAATSWFIVWQKKVSLVDRVGCWHVKF